MHLFEHILRDELCKRRNEVINESFNVVYSGETVNTLCCTLLNVYCDLGHLIIKRHYVNCSEE